jgi:hypothetical protein
VLTERLASFKSLLLSELEGGLLGAWGSQLKAAAAAEAAQQVEAGLQVRGWGKGFVQQCCACQANDLGAALADQLARCISSPRN